MTDQRQAPERPSYLVGLLIVGVAIITGSLFTFIFQLAGTEPMYLRMTRNFLAGNGFSVQDFPPFHPEMFRMPMYPLFVAAIFSVLGEAKVYLYVAQIGLFALASFLFYLFAIRIVDRVCAALSGMVLAAYPGAAFYTGGVLSEVMALTIFLALMWTLVRWKDSESLRPLLLIGLLVGVVVLVRPGFVFFPLFILMADLLRRVKIGRALTRFAIIGAIAFLVVLPWMVRNYLVSEHFVPLTIEASQSFYLGSLEVGKYTGRPYADNPRYEIERRQFNLDLLEYGSPQEQIAANRQHWELAFLHIQETPFHFLLASFIRAFRMWISTDYLLGEKPIWFLYGAALMSGGTFALGVLGIWVNRAHICRLAFALVPIVYFPTTHLFFHIESRYTLPARPFLLLFAVMALREIYRQMIPKPALFSSSDANLDGRTS